ncbi:MAG: TetR/AcrR family transcriptional regulator [Bacillota bacterium]|nr:TetR/AcrR family transcriptional regulator [Bacillota bacterium]
MKKGGKELILDAARVVIARNGVNNASVQAIVDEAGISKGAFYYHYKGKDYILYDMIDQFLRAAIKPVKQSFYESGDIGKIKDSLIESIYQRLDNTEHNKLQFYLTHEALLGDDEIHDKFAKKYNGWVDTGEELMKKMYDVPPSRLNRALAATAIAAIDGQVIQILLEAEVVSIDDLICLWKILIDKGIPALLQYLHDDPEGLVGE